MKNESFIVLSRVLVPSVPIEVSDYRTEDLKSLIALGPIANTNIFVGSTNSGKSRLMRILMRALPAVLVTDKGDTPCAMRLILAGDEYLKELEKLGKTLKEGLDPSTKRLTLTCRISAQDFREPHRSIHNTALSFVKGQTKQTATLPLTTVLINDSYFATVLKNVTALFTEEGKQRGEQSALTALSNDYAMWHAIRMVLDEPQSGLGLLYEIHGLSRNANLRERARTHLEVMTSTLREIISTFPEVDITEARTTQNTPTLRAIYIPTLRTAHTIASDERRIGTNLFSNNIAQQYSISTKSVEIFTGLELYDSLDRNVRGRRRNEIREFERFLSSNFFENIEVEVIPEHRDETVKRTAVDGGKPDGVITIRLGEFERPIHLFGDGIQSLIILIYNLFTSQPGTWFFIDEPEISLHPGLQRAFIEAITSNDVIRAKGYKFFLTTHSNHLLDLTISKKNTAFYSLRPHVENAKQKFIIRERGRNTNLSDTIVELGVLNSSVLMANCSVWVEGITDRIYVRKILREYCLHAGKVLLEDLHFSFFEYSGGNLTHYIWDSNAAVTTPAVPSGAAVEPPKTDDDGETEDETEEAQADSAISMQLIANRVFLISDRDEGKTAKHNVWEQQARNSGGMFEYYITPGREIENLLPPEVIKKILSSDGVRLKDKNNKLVASSLIQNATLIHSAYCRINENDGAENVGLARYIAETLDLKEGAMQPRNSQTGTFNTARKKQFARLAAEKMTWENMGKPAKKLAEQLYNFIVRHNQ